MGSRKNGKIALEKIRKYRILVVFASSCAKMQVL